MTVALLLVVLGGLLTVFESVQRSAAFVQERSETLDEMRIALDQMTKEIRQAEEVKAATSTASRLEMTTYILGVQKTVVYAVTGQTLTKSVGGSGTAPIQTHVAAPSIFTYTTDTAGVIQLVSLNLQVHPERRPDTTIILTSEARLRNEAGT